MLLRSQIAVRRNQIPPSAIAGAWLGPASDSTWRSICGGCHDTRILPYCKLRPLQRSLPDLLLIGAVATCSGEVCIT